MRYILILALSLGLSAYSPGQTPNYSPEPKSEPVSRGGRSPQPVIYGKGGDGYPQSLKIRGVIAEVTFVPVACGVLCHWGTAKIKLLEKPQGYEHDYVYVTVLCFMGEEDNFVGKIVDMRVTKLMEGRHPTCSGIVNAIDSGGVVFYEPIDGKNRLTGKLKMVSAVKPSGQS